MAMIELPKKFHPDFASPGVKLAGPVEIDFNGIGRDLLWYHDCNSLGGIYERDKKVNLSVTQSGVSTVGTANGLSQSLDSTSSYFYYDDDSYIRGNINRQSFTFFVDIDFVSGSNSNFLFANAANSSTVYNWGIYYHNASTSIISYVKTGGSAASTPTGQVAASGRLRIVTTYDGANIVQYCNGKQCGSVAKAGSVDITAADIIFERWNSNARCTIKYRSAGVINRALSESEAISLSLDPYQILKPAVPVFLSVGGGGPSTQTLLVSSIATSEAFGQPNISFPALSVACSAIASGEALGQISIDTSRIISPSAIPSLEAFGLNQVTTGAVTVSALGIASGENMGLISIVAGTAVNPDGIATGETIGQPSVQALAVDISPTGVGSLEAFGLPVVPREAITVSVTSAQAGEVMGEPLIEVGAVTVSVNSAQEGETMGDPTVMLATLYVRPEGIYSGMTFGRVVLVGGDFVYVSSDYAVVSPVVTGVVQSVVTSLAA